MADQGQANSGGFSRFLFLSILVVASLLGGIFVGFYFGHLVPGLDLQAPAAAADGGTPEAQAEEAGAGAGVGVVHETCTIHLRGSDGALRGDLAKVALLDGEGKQVLEPELVHDTTVRIACPEQALTTELVAQDQAGELFLVADVILDPARGYFEHELPGDATALDAVSTRWTELGLGDAPAWLSEAPSGDAGDAGGDAAGPGIDLGEPREIENDLYIEFRDIVGESRGKQDLRSAVKTNAYQIEACIRQKGDDLDRARHSFFVAINKDGEVADAQLLQGESDEVDACVAQVMASWDFGASDESSFFQLKMVWTES